MKESPFIIDPQELGIGAENSTHQILDENGTPTELVLKKPTYFGKGWQTMYQRQHQLTFIEKYGEVAIRALGLNGKETLSPEKPYMKRCLEVTTRHELPTIEMEVHTNTEVIEGTNKSHQEIVLVVPHIKDIDEKKLRYVDLLDPQHGPTRIRQLLKFLQAGEDIRDIEQMGLDLLGGEVVLDIIKTAIQAKTIEVIKYLPNPLKSKILEKITGTRCEIRNLIKTMNGTGEENLLLIDPGMHDLGPNGKFKPITKLINRLATAALAEGLAIANRRHSLWKQLNEAEIRKISPSTSHFEKELVKKLARMMTEMAERYEKTSNLNKQQ